MILAAVLSAPGFRTAAHGGERPAPVIINHNCVNLEAIPADVIDLIKANRKWHYVRTSHGTQLHEGFTMLEDEDPAYRVAWPDYGGYLVNEPGALCMYTERLGPDGYWLGSGSDDTREVLDGNPTLNVSAFCWCAELNAASESYVNEYLSTMSLLEAQYPDVVFVYFTGTAEYDGSYGYNRYLRNQQIRQYCLAHNKVLYDFADLDCWWYNPDSEQWEQSTYQYNGHTVPVEHPQLAGNETSHTSYASCRQKARAAWWLMAVLEGWTGTLEVTITSFQAACKDRAVALSWEVSATEVIYGYNIYRTEYEPRVECDTGPFYRINSVLVPPCGNHAFIDADVTTGKKYTYRLGAVGAQREYLSSPASVTVTSNPVNFLRNYPNPCNPSTTISFSLAAPGRIDLSIFNAAGKKIATLLDGYRNEGPGSVHWNGTNERGESVQSGVYFYRLRVEKKSITRKLLLLK